LGLAPKREIVYVPVKRDKNALTEPSPNREITHSKMKTTKLKNPARCSPLLGKRVRAIDGTEGTIVEVAQTPRHKLTIFHVQTDDGREAALFPHDFEVLKANA